MSSVGILALGDWVPSRRGGHGRSCHAGKTCSPDRNERLAPNDGASGPRRVEKAAVERGRRWMASCFEGFVAVLVQDLRPDEPVRIRGPAHGVHTWKARRTAPRPGSHIACTWTNTCRLLSYPVSQRASLASFWPPCPLVVLLRPRFPCSNSQNRRPHHPPRGACASHQTVFTLGIKAIFGFHAIPSYPVSPPLWFSDRFFFDSWSQGAASSLIFLFPTNVRPFFPTPHRKPPEARVVRSPLAPWSASNFSGPSSPLALEASSATSPSRLDPHTSIESVNRARHLCF